MSLKNPKETPRPAEAEPKGPEAKEGGVPPEEERPWAEEEKKEEERLLLKYGEGAEISKKTRGCLDGLLQQETDRRKIEFAKKWFDDNQKKLVREGVAVDVAESRKVAIAIEKGAFSELKTKEKYKKDYGAIENLYALRTDCRAERLAVDSQFLLLNFLEEKRSEIGTEIEELKKEEGKEVEIGGKEKELKDLFGVRKELAEKATGRDFTREVEAQLRSEEEYVAANLSDEKQRKERIKIRIEIIKRKWQELPGEKRAEYGSPKAFAEEIEREKITARVAAIYKEWEVLSKEEKAKKYNNDPRQLLFLRDIESQKDPQKRNPLSGDAFYELLRGGYRPKEIKWVIGIFREKIHIPGEEQPLKLSPEEFKKFAEDADGRAKKEIEEKTKAELKKEWQEKREKTIREGIENRIKELASAPERAAGGVEKMYAKIKERLIAEYKEKGLKKQEKSPAETKQIEKEFGKKRKKGIPEFVEEGMSRKGKLSELTGDHDKDAECLVNFFGDYGVEITKEDVGRAIKTGDYKEKIKRKGGFLYFLFQLAIKAARKIKEQAQREAEGY